MFATISCSGRILRLVFAWWYVIVRLVVCVIARSAMIGEDRWKDQLLEIVRLLVAIIDRSYACDQSLCRVTDRTINRGVRQPIARSIVASCDRNPTNRGICHRSYDWSYPQSQSRATNRDRSRVVALPNVMSCDGWYHQSSGGTTSCTTNRVTA